MTRIGKYEVRRELGGDAFSRSFQAFDPDASRPVTILALTESADEQVRARFRNDAAAAAQIHHRNVAAIYELGEQGGLPFIAMQSREGEDLTQVIAKRASVTLLQKMSLMSEVAQALQAAHRAGLGHVGLRPAGIVVSADGSVRVSEFGAVRSVWAATAGALYVAPEELTGAAPADALSDIFAYGIVYYELLVGKHPFHSTGADGMALRIVQEQPVPLRTWSPECPEPLEKIVGAALQKERELRYQSWDDVLWDAEPILQVLRRERAVALLIEGRRWAGEGQLDRAQELAREALTLVPGYPPAQRLRDALRDQAQRRLIQSRVEALLQQADNEASARRFSSAIQILESASRLDGTEAAILDRLEKVRALLEKSLRASALVEEARRWLEGGDLSQAIRQASEALEADSQCEEAQRLRDQLEEEQKRRERAAAVRQTLEEAQWLMEQHHPDLAAQLLRQRAAAYPEAAEVAERLAVAERAARSWEKRRFVEEMLERVANLEQREQWRTAWTVLQEALRAEPEATQLREAAQRLRSRLDAEERRRKLARRFETIRRRIVEQNWTEALSLIDATRKEYPLEPELQSLLAKARAGQRRAECENAIRGMQQCLADGDLEQAAEMLGQVRQYHLEESKLQTLREAFEREKAFQDQWREAEMLFGRSQFAQAEKILVELAAQKPTSHEVPALLETVRSGRAAADEVGFYKQGRVKALRLLEEQQWDQAADLLRNLLALFPNDAILERDLQSVLAARERRQEEPAEPAKKPAPAATSEHEPPGEGTLHNREWNADAAWPRWFPPPVPLWRRPAVLTFGAFLVVAPAALTVWKYSRRQHSVALASAGAAAPRAAPPVATPQVAGKPTEQNTAAPPPSHSPAGPSDVAAISRGAPGPLLASTTPPVVIGDKGPQVATPEHLQGEGEFRNAELLSGPNLVVPPLARNRRVSGIVKLEATISKEGIVTNVVVVSGHPWLTEAAKQAILARRYRPATLNGQPVEVKIPIQVVLEPER